MRLNTCDGYSCSAEFETFDRKEQIMKSALQLFEEKEQKECCLQCSKLIEKQGNGGKIYFLWSLWKDNTSEIS